MEPEKFAFRAESKKCLDELISEDSTSQTEVRVPIYARMHVPCVFEQQYGDYIAGLKPSYTRSIKNIRFSFKNNKANQKEGNYQKLSGD